MIHFAVFAYLFVILVGIICLTIALFLYLKNKNKFFLNFLIYFSAFTFFIFSYLFIQTYIMANISQVGFYLLISVIGIILSSYGFLLFAILHFGHFLVFETPSAKMMVIELLTAIAATMGMILSFRINANNQEIYQVQNYGLFFSLALLFGVIIYSLILKLVHLKNIRDERKVLIKQTLMMNFIFLPGFALDLYFLQKLNFSIFIPIFYLCSSLLFLRYFIKNPIPGIAEIRAENSNALQLNNKYLDQAGISTREKEIIELLLKGYSNRKIADQLFISISTVKTHIRNVFQKLGVKSRFEIISKIKSLP